MTTEQMFCDIAVVGAGPAGLAAAETAARSGARVVLLDLFAYAGGQYHMQPSARNRPLHGSHQARLGRHAISRCESAGVRIVTGAEVFWVEPGYQLLARHGIDALRIASSALVAATGASERVLPFKGWTLPGVITAGAAQRLVKMGGTRPGRRIVLAGSGPFLLAVASTFAAAGIELTAYVEAARAGLDGAKLLAKFPARMGEAIRLGVGMVRTRPHWLQGHIVTEALGETRVEAVRVAPISPQGLIRSAESRVIEDVDALCVSYGFRPAVEITSVLKADHFYSEPLGGWTCAADASTGATSVPVLFAAGEVTGLAGAHAAHLSGMLAGFHAARSLGFSGAPDFKPEKIARRLLRARSFAASLAALFPLPEMLLDVADADEIVCRCEDVTLGEVLAAAEDGATDAFGVKMWTRAGMGSCQGRICGQAITSLLSRRLSLSPAEIGFNHPHLPLRPVPLDIVAAALRN